VKRAVALLLLVGPLNIVLGDLVFAASGTSPSYGLSASENNFDLQALRALAEQGDKRAAFLLATHYVAGRGVPRDDSEAVRWFTVATEAGLAEAQYNLGIMYVTGRGLPRDPAAAVVWYTRAAEQGLVEAQFNLGTAYGTGLGVRRDEALAAQWLERAARHGLARAQYSLAALYEHGRGVRLNARTALDWYQKAADQGFERAKVRHAALVNKMQLQPEGDSSPVSTTSAEQHQKAQEPVVISASVPTTPEPAEGGAADKDDDDWVRHAFADRFTMQLASYSSRADAMRFARSLGSEARVGIYVSWAGGKQRYAVVRGEFESHQSASAAVAKLPAKLRKMKPWVRNFGQIQQQMK
jgi:hypothetical protein